MRISYFVKLLEEERITVNELTAYLSRKGLLSFIHPIHKALVDLKTYKSSQNEVVVESPFEISKEAIQVIIDRHSLKKVPREVLNKELLAGYRIRNNKREIDFSAKALITKFTNKQ